MHKQIVLFFLLSLPLCVSAGRSPGQLPRAMHLPMDELPEITVGAERGDIVGTDNRALQAAVDYIAGLGGGIVNIGPGTYMMYDSLHLRSNVTVRGSGPATVLRKAPAASSPLVCDGDFGQEQVTLKKPEGFAVGYGIAVWDERAGGFHVTCARITGRKGDTFSIDRPLMADYLVRCKAQAATIFPVISAYNTENAAVENLQIEGNRGENLFLTGCRGAGIFLYRAHRTTIQRCIVRSYNGDGISFQQSNDVIVEECVCEGNAHLGIHPGSGSQRPIVRRCIARKNDDDGLFLCWRVRFGLFENNLLCENGRFGISIGHKDSDNILRFNMVTGNRSSGIFFRNETFPMAPHRNRLIGNIIENNGEHGIRIRGEVTDLVFRQNLIIDTRAPEKQTQRVGVLIEERAGKITLEDNLIIADQPVVRRRAAPR